MLFSRCVILREFSSILLRSTSFSCSCTSSYLASKKFHTSPHKNNESKPPWNVMFFGSDEFALHHLEALNKNRLKEDGGPQVVNHLEVVVPKMRKTCLAGQYAATHDLPVHMWPLSADRDHQCDLGIVTSFGHLITEKVINMFPWGMLNVHPSLLPRWRGAAPIAHTLLYGDLMTGISIIEIKPKKFDVGAVLLQEKFPVPDSFMASQLTMYLAKTGTKMLLGSLSNLESLKASKQQQSSEEVLLAPKLTPKIAVIDWEKQCVLDIDRQFRAVSEKYPLRSEWLGQQIRFLDMLSFDKLKDYDLEYLSKRTTHPKPGLPMYDSRNKILFIRCKDGWVGFKNVIFKQLMTAKAFNNGYLSDGRNPGATFSSLRMLGDT